MDYQQCARELNGLYAALFTPFNGNNQIDFDQVSRLVNFQLNQGLGGFFVCGTTGEGLLLSFDERVELVRAVVDFCRDRPLENGEAPKVIAHVGHPSTDVSVRLAKEADKAGANWIGSVGPVFYGNSFEGTQRHYRAIAKATELPFMIYALQSNISPERDRALFDIENVAAVKYTGSDFFSLQQLARRVEKDIAWISGMDEMFVAGQTMGCQAGIGSTYNFMPEKFVQMLEYCNQNNFQAAIEIQKEVNQVIDYFCSFENWSYRKAFMRYIGLDCGPCRPPYEALTDDQYSRFANGLQQIGLLQADRIPSAS